MNIKEISQEIHQINKDKGFWEGGKAAKNFGEAIALIHSELSEALECHRKGQWASLEVYNKYEHALLDPIVKETMYKQLVKESVEAEMADVAIRLFDVCEGFGIDLETHIRLKVDYNKTREFKHGKNY